MDKYEYQVCADQIKQLITERRFTDAMDIADTIDWRRVKSFSMLCTVSEIYKVTKHYSEARDILLLAYERYPDRANVVYALCELAIKLDDISESVEYYKEYVRLKPHDTNRYVLLYKIYEAQDVPLEEKISLLEEFKKAEYTEKWAYELATLYHKDGQETKCVETCDELVLWFGDGPFVRKALELKMQHAPLTKEQQRKYDGVYDGPTISKNDNEETVHIYETQSMNAYANGASPFETAPIETGSEPAKPQYSNAVNNMPQSYSQGTNYNDIQVQPVSTDKYSTISLQEELAKNMEEFYAKEKDEAPAPYYGSTTQLYEPSQQQFMDRINQAGPLANEQPVQPMYEQPMQYEQPVQPVYEQPMQYQQPVQQMYEQPMQYQQPVQPMYEQPMQYQQPMQQMYEQPVQYQQPVQQMYEQPVTYEQPVQPVYEQQAPPAYEQPIKEAPKQVETMLPQEDIAEEDVSPRMTTDRLPVYEEPNTVYASKAPVTPYEEPKVSVNPNPVVRMPKEMEEKLREGLDGQVTMALPDAQEIEKQITGQIDISDFMADWEAKKKNAEEQRRAQIKAKSLEQTSDIMSQLVGVIPGIDTPPIEKAEEKEEKVVEEPIKTEEVLRNDDKAVVTKTTLSSPSFDRETPVKRSESGAVINGPLKSSITGEIPDILPSADLPIKGDVLPSGRKLTLDEEWGGNIAKIRKEDEELVKRLTGELPPVEEETEEAIEEPVEDYGETEEIEDIEQPDVVLEGEEEEKEAEKIEIEPATKPEEHEEIKQLEVKLPEVEVKQPKVEEEEAQQEQEVQEEATEEPITYPYEIEDDLGEVEVLEEIDQPDDVDDMLKTRPIPVEEIEARQRYEAGIEDDDSEEKEVEDKKPNVPSYVTRDKFAKSRREFDEAEVEIFGRFEGIESLKSQIVDVMDDMSMSASHGNVVVTGAEIFDRKALAIDIVRAIQTIDSNFSGKVAKISGEALNKKDIPVTMSKLRNGALIVENAGGLTPVTVNSITETLLATEDPILVVFEGDKDSIDPLLNGCNETKKVFNARIAMDDFTDDDLVAYGKGYAREQGYSIDDLGTLALHTRIAEMQTYDHVVSVDEAIEIVDAAIRHADRKNVGHFMDVLLAKRYDDNDYIVLREKDFIM